MAIINIQGEDYSVTKILVEFWNKNSLENMKKKNSDRVYIVDGRERSGKSTWTIQQMGYLDPEAFKDVETFLSRVCISAEEFNETARKVKNGVVIFDEGFRGFSSRSALSKTNKILIQTLMEMGQNNNILFIVLPSFFLLDMYPALLRSNALFHIEEDVKTKIRVFKGYNNADKNYMYRMGARKGWNYKRTIFYSKFFNKFPGGDKYLNAYLKKKEKAFIDMSDSMKHGAKESEETILIMNIIKEVYNKVKSIRKLREEMIKKGFDRSIGWYSGVLGIKSSKKVQVQRSNII